MTTIFKHVFPTLRFYWKSHVLVILGVAISTMVLTGTLTVGDSIESSLEKATFLRLGKTDFVFSGVDRYFRASLADELKQKSGLNSTPLLQLRGIGSTQGGTYQLNNIQIIGIDSSFTTSIPSFTKSLFFNENEVFISENVAQRLQLKIGDPITLRIEKANQIPKNAPFISEGDQYVSMRLQVGQIFGPEELGRFNLKISQTAPYNVFIPLSILNSKMGFDNKANHILFAIDNDKNEKTLLENIQKHWTLEDMSLEIHDIDDNQGIEIRSDRVFIDETIVQAIKQVDPEAHEILTYLVNSLRAGNKETPYSFVSAGPFMKTNRDISSDDMIINQWVAEDLQVSVGDSLEISYYIIGPLRRLSEESEWFKITDIVPIEGIYAQRSLMPQIPGLSDAGNCRDWRTGVPVDLNRIRDKDEDYWNDYRGTPKAFISYSNGKELWKNRFGKCTAVRLSSAHLTRDELERRLLGSITPTSLGFSLKSVKNDGLVAARGGIDFSQLFMGLSFFLLIAGLILMALLFNLHLEKRKVEIGTLKALGYSYGLIRRIFLFEVVFLAIPGVILGGWLAMFYNKMIFNALNTVWNDIVRTNVLQEDTRIGTLLLGMGIAFFIVLMTMWLNVTKKLSLSAKGLQKEEYVVSNRKSNVLKYGSLVSGLIVVLLLVYEIFVGDTLNSGMFFLAGGLFLLTFILFASYWIRHRSQGQHDKFSFQSLLQRNLFINQARSLRIIILFSLGTFVVISTGLNRKDLYSGAKLPSSGTGGFLFYAETTLPVLQDLNSPKNIADLGMDTSIGFVQLRVHDGDDASCLNLNRVSTPRILGIPSDKLKGRFSFVKIDPDIDPNNPWNALKTKLNQNIIPAFADQTVIQWGLGKKVGDTLTYQDEFGEKLRLKIIGGLENSIFQGNILVDENLFLDHFPSNSGTNVLLIDGPFDNMEETAGVLSRVFRNEGLEMEHTADRLNTFNQVENTYLTIFLLLGGFALIMGTFGLGIVIIRNIIDRVQEIGILEAIGFQKKDILKLITLEHGVLLVIGTVFGTIAAFLAITPSLISEFISASWKTAIIIVGVILLNGFFWIILITRRILRQELFHNLRTE